MSCNMDQKKIERSFKEIYKGFLEEEVKRPQVRRSQQDFLDAHFPKEPIFILRPLVLAPSLAMLALLAIFVYLKGPMMQASRSSVHATSIPAASTLGQIAPAPETTVPGASETPMIAPRVTVNRITSRVGSTMVYQKPYNGHPITIVWVFVGGSAG